MKKWIYIAVFLAFGAAFAATYSSGVYKGEQTVQKLWDADVKAKQAIIETKELELARIEGVHAAESAQHSQALKSQKESYEEYIRNLALDHAHRMQQSSSRASVYHRQAQAGEAERRNLAEHCSRLDASIVEGKAVAGELRHTLELRDKQLITVGNQLLSDRKAISNE